MYDYSFPRRATGVGVPLEGEKVMREPANIYIDLEMEVQSNKSFFW
jgi:hypothetical protein